MVQAISTHPRHLSNRKARRANNSDGARAATGTPGEAAAKHKANEAEATRLATVTGETPAGTKQAHLLTAHTEGMREKVLRKSELMGSARKILREAAVMYSLGDTKEKEAAAVATQGTAPLYQARAEGLITQDELTATLGDIFGYKAKSDGTPSKTPKPHGEYIRKRIVRGVAAKEFVETGDGGRFFVGIPKEAVAPLVERLDAADLSVWQAYDRLTEIKREAALGRVEPALNAKIMAGIVERLGKPDAPAMIADNPALLPIYAALLDQLLVLDGRKPMIGEVPETAKPTAMAA